MDRLRQVLSKITDKLEIIRTEIQEQKKNKRKLIKSKTINQVLFNVYRTDEDKSTITNLVEAFTIAINYKESTKEEITEVLKLLDKILRTIYDNLNCYHTGVGQFRKILKTKTEPEYYYESFNYLGLTPKETEDRYIRYMEKVKQRNLNRGEMPVIYVEDVLLKIQNLYKSRDIYDKILCGLLCCGLRYIELIEKSNIQKTGEDQITISNLAKQSKLLKHRLNTRYVIGLNTDEFLIIIEEIRKAVTDTIITSGPYLILLLNRKFRSIFPEIPDGKLHYCRVLYANINFEIYGKEKNIPYETYIQSQLNHVDCNSTKSYLHINLKTRTIKKCSNMKHTEAIELLKEEHQEQEGKKKRIRMNINVVKNNIKEHIKELEINGINYTNQALCKMFNINNKTLNKILFELNPINGCN